MTNKSKILLTVVRIVLGSIFVLSGLNGLFGLLPPPPLTGAAAQMWGGLAQAGAVFPIMKGVELTAGLLLLSGRGVPFALAALAPVIVNVAGFHLAVAPQALPIVLVLLGCWLALAWQHRAAFRTMLSRQARPTRSGLAARAGALRAVEIAMGLVFVISAVSAALGKTPPPSTTVAAALMRGLEASGYFIPLLIGVQFVAGVMLVTRRFVPLALVALAPIVVEILAYRFIARGTAMFVVSLALVIAEAWLAWCYRSAFAPLLFSHPLPAHPGGQGQTPATPENLAPLSA